MQNRYKLSIFFLVIVVCVLIWGASLKTPLQGNRIGIVDMDRIFKHYDKWKDITKYLEDREETHQEEAEALAGEINGIEKRMADMGVDDARYKKTQTQLIRKRTYLETLLKQYEKELRQTEITQYEAVCDEIEQLIAKTAKENRLYVVFQKSLELPEGYWKCILYHRQELDITTAIVNRLNSRYREEK